MTVGAGSKKEIFEGSKEVVYRDSLYPVPDTYVPKHLHTFNELFYLMAPDHPVYLSGAGYNESLYTTQGLLDPDAETHRRSRKYSNIRYWLPLLAIFP